MRAILRFGVLLLVLAFFLQTAHAAPQDEKFRLGFQMALGMGGEADFDAFLFSVDYDLEPSVGFQFFGLYPVFRYLAIGLQIGMGWHETEEMDEADIDRNFFLDFSPALMVRYPLLNDKLELYIFIPFGLTISVFSDESVDTMGFDVDSAGVGWNASVMLGANYLVFSNLRVMAEFGWQGHGASHDINPSTYGEIDATMHQFAIHFGGSWSF